MRRGAKPGKAKVVAKRPRPRTSPKDEASKRPDLEKRLAESLEREKAKDRALTEALEQQTATSEVLGAISRSPMDIQPVLDTVVESAARLCEAYDASIVLRRDNRLVMAAHHGPIHDASAIARALGTTGGYTLSLDRGTIGGRTVLDVRTVHIEDVQVEAEEFPEASENARRLGFHTMLSVPLMREDVAIGAIQLPRTEVRLFTERQVALLKTFADQAVIAIENVRLFKETKEALEQQTATSEILRVISQSPTDVQPVFDVIGERAEKLCDAEISIVSRVDGELIQLAALHGVSEQAVEIVRRIFPMPRDAETLMARAVRRGVVVHVPDVLADAEYGYKDTARTTGQRGCLAVPMVREGQVIGAIFVARRQPGPFSNTQVELLKTFADQAVIAIQNVRLFKELEARNRDLTATSQILQVISRSPTDVRPVFDTILANAARLCDAHRGALLLFRDGVFETGAELGTPLGLSEARRTPYRPEPHSHSLLARIVVERRAIFVPDLRVYRAYEEREPRTVAAVELAGSRSMLAVPLLKEDVLIGAITIHRPESGPFSEEHISLLKTFADQAVIAIENVRLFNELQASNRELTTALDQQTATSDILRVISRSQTNVQPVFDAIVASAVRLLGGYTGALTRIAGDQIAIAATTGHDAASEAAVRAAFPASLQSEVPHAQAIRDRVPLNIADYQTDPRLPEALRASAAIRGYRSVVVVPMLLHDEAIGAIGVTRRDPGGFTDDEIALLRTFADQAVIAIENVRLFNELEGKNVALTAAHAQVTEALEQQTATAEILRVISSSPTDVQPVFDAIVESAVRLCDARYGAVFNFDGDLVHLMAHHNVSETALEGFREQYPMRPTRAHISGRAILSGSVVQIPDVTLDPEYGSPYTVPQGFRSLLAVPILRGGAPIGAIVIYRPESGMLSDEQISLLQTFAAQAVIAIENVRLFKELQARTHELTRSVDQLTALGEISQAVSSTLDVETVLQTVVSRASQLAGADGCAIYEYDDATEAFHIRATHHLDPILVATLRASPLRKGEGAIGRAAETREPTQVADIAVPGAYQSHIRDTLLGAGYRALLSVPLLREGEVIGSLSLNRRVPGQFPREAVEVLKTFATQSALAIQNARLFREIADKSAQLEAASRHKSEFLANMSHELRTPLNAIIGFSEVLTERMFGELNEKQDEYLKDIYASGQHLLSLINDILDLSKIEAGRMELEATDFDLPSAIDNALILVRERATRRGITLGHSVDERLGSIRGDERKVKQVLLNLLSNALKFTPEGGRIDVSARVHDGVAEVSVTDTGVGIAPEDQEAVFEEFRQVGTADKKVEGTGLGLALSRKFIELHGGKIWVKSQVGAGSTFTFTLPVHRGG